MATPPNLPSTRQPTPQTLFQVLGVQRSRPAGPMCFASVSTHKMSIHATQPYNCTTPSWPPPPPAAAEAVQLQPETFNLAECSRHLNYLTVVLVQGGGHGG